MLRKPLSLFWWAILSMFWLAFAARPALAGRHSSIKQFEQGLAEAKGEPDLEFARWVFGFELNERVSVARLARWKEGVPGDEGRRALVALADLSAFQNLPADEITKTAALDKGGQERVIAEAGIYVEQTLTKLPNFFATQSVTTFEDSPKGANGFYEPLHYSGFKSGTVFYRNGKEVIETHKGGEVTDTDQTASTWEGLMSSGEFGPVLRTVLTDAQNGKLSWSHWEMLGATKVAVFSYSITEGKSHYKVNMVLPGHSTPVGVTPGYYGEIGIDPVTGTILRLTIRAAMGDEGQISQADLMVEYGSVGIGGKTYICPVRSVARVAAFQGLYLTMGRAQAHNREEIGLQTVVNDVQFGNYRAQHSEARMITGADMDDDPEKP